MIVVLDAMGVIYKNGDDVGELLVPFVQQHSDVDTQYIEKEYLRASLGEISSNEFWENMGLSSELESEYISLFTLNPGVNIFLEHLKNTKTPVALLSNDVSEWSKKLRESFELDKFIDHWIVSGDVGSRKPALEIYELVMHQIASYQDAEILFVDDRIHNLDSAGNIGWETYHFCGADSSAVNRNRSKHIEVSSFAELLKLIKMKI